MNDAEIRYRIKARQLLASGEAKELRLAAGLTLDETAQEVGVADGVTVCRWESGSRHPQGRFASRYGELLCRLQRQVRRRSVADQGSSEPLPSVPAPS